MINRKKILLAINDKELLAGMALSLVQMGYFVSGVITKSEDVKERFRNTRSDLVIEDKRGQILKELPAPWPDIPSILIIDTETSHSGNELQTTLHYPFSKKILKECIDTVISQYTLVQVETNEHDSKTAEALKLEDRIFVRYKDKMVKLEIADILYIEADSNYSRIFAKGKEYLLAITLKTMETKLPLSDFFRIHRSYIVNLRQIDEVAETHLVISRKALPISKTLRPRLLKRLQTI